MKVILVVVSIVLFVLAGIGVSLGSIGLVPIGLAFLAGSTIA